MSVCRRTLQRRSPARWCAGLAAFVVFSNSALPAGPGDSSRSAVLLEGEELVYNVRYSIIDLGQIRIRTLGKSRTANAVSYNGKAYIDSYESIPFVDAHAVFESAIDSTVFSRGFVGRSKEGDYWDFTRYSMDYSAKRLYMEFGGRDSVVQKRDTLELAGAVQDGLSLFFFARDRLMANRSVQVPVIIKDREYNCTINFRNDRRTAEVDAINYPIDVVHFDGTADFVGFYGLTGDFEGWFSNDDARVPILAKMRVLIGSVTIELIEWKRVGWVPPKAAE